MVPDQAMRSTDPKWRQEHIQDDIELVKLNNCNDNAIINAINAFI